MTDAILLDLGGGEYGLVTDSGIIYLLNENTGESQVSKLGSSTDSVYDELARGRNGVRVSARATLSLFNEQRDTVLIERDGAFERVPRNDRGLSDRVIDLPVHPTPSQNPNPPRRRSRTSGRVRRPNRPTELRPEPAQVAGADRLRGLEGRLGTQANVATDPGYNHWSAGLQVAEATGTVITGAAGVGAGLFELIVGYISTLNSAHDSVVLGGRLHGFAAGLAEFVISNSVLNSSENEGQRPQSLNFSVLRDPSRTVPYRHSGILNASSTGRSAMAIGRRIAAEFIEAIIGNRDIPLELWFNPDISGTLVQHGGAGHQNLTPPVPGSAADQRLREFVDSFPSSPSPGALQGRLIRMLRGEERTPSQAAMDSRQTHGQTPSTFGLQQAIQAVPLVSYIRSGPFAAALRRFVSRGLPETQLLANRVVRSIPLPQGSDGAAYRIYVREVRLVINSVRRRIRSGSLTPTQVQQCFNWVDTTLASTKVARHPHNFIELFNLMAGGYRNPGVTAQVITRGATARFRTTAELSTFRRLLASNDVTEVFFARVGRGRTPGPTPRNRTPDFVARHRNGEFIRIEATSTIGTPTLPILTELVRKKLHRGQLRASIPGFHLPQRGGVLTLMVRRIEGANHAQMVASLQNMGNQLWMQFQNHADLQGFVIFYHNIPVGRYGSSLI